MDEPNQLSEEGVGKIVLGIVRPRTEWRKMEKAIGKGEIPLLLPSELTKHDPNIGPHVPSIPAPTPLRYSIVTEATMAAEAISGRLILDAINDRPYRCHQYVIVNYQ